MAAKKVGALVKEARTKAGLTQEKLAKAAGENLTAAEIGKCERGEADLTTAQLKKIAVACGVTQTSLVNAPKNLSASAAKKAAAAKTTTAKTTAAKKTTTAKTTTAAKKTTTAKTTAAKTTTAKKTTTAAKTAAVKTPANANVSMKVTSAEQKLIQAYRAAGSDRKKYALKLLNGDYGDSIDKLLGGAEAVTGSTAANGIGGLLGDALGDVLGNLISRK